MASRDDRDSGPRSHRPIQRWRRFQGTRVSPFRLRPSRAASRPDRQPRPGARSPEPGARSPEPGAAGVGQIYMGDNPKTGSRFSRR